MKTQLEDFLIHSYLNQEALQHYMGIGDTSAQIILALVDLCNKNKVPIDEKILSMIDEVMQDIHKIKKLQPPKLNTENFTAKHPDEEQILI